MISFQDFITFCEGDVIRGPWGRTDKFVANNNTPNKNTFAITQDTMDRVADIRAKREQNKILDKKATVKGVASLSKVPDAVAFFNQFNDWVGKIIADRPSGAGPNPPNVDFIMVAKNNKVKLVPTYATVENFLKSLNYQEIKIKTVSYNMWINTSKGYGILVYPNRGSGINVVEFAPLATFKKMQFFPKIG